MNSLLTDPLVKKLVMSLRLNSISFPVLTVLVEGSVFIDFLPIKSERTYLLSISAKVRLLPRRKVAGLAGYSVLG